MKIFMKLKILKIRLKYFVRAAQKIIKVLKDSDESTQISSTEINSMEKSFTLDTTLSIVSMTRLG